jgi:heme/copper-type cytochrome/quinol oxidase subunit 1
MCARPPFLFAAGFVAQFIVGGLSGVMVATVPFDWQTTDTYFVVADLHYVLIGGTLFGVFAGFHYWLPKMTGRLLDDRLGTFTFWRMVVGFNLAFLHVSAGVARNAAPRLYVRARPRMGDSESGLDRSAHSSLAWVRWR